MSKLIKLRLDTKIFILVSLPLLAFVFTALSLIRSSYSDYKTGVKYRELVQPIPEFVDLVETQVNYVSTVAGGAEQGMGKSVNLETAKSSAKLFYHTYKPKSGFQQSSEALTSILGQSDSLESSMTEIDPVIINEWFRPSEKIIPDFYNSLASDFRESPWALERIRAIGYLEQVKQSSNRLTILLIDILSKKEAVDSVLVEDLSNRVNQIDMLLGSIATGGSLRAIERVELLRESKDFFAISTAFYDISRSRKSGRFSSKPETLVKSYNSFDAAVTKEIGNEILSLQKEIAQQVSSAYTSYAYLACLIAGLCILLIALCLYLARDINRSFSSAVSELVSSADYVHLAANQLSSSSQSMSADAFTSASSLEETVAHIEELASMVEGNAEKAVQANDLATLSTDSARKGEVEIGGLLVSMKEIMESSRQVEEITKVIDEIAYQTNLLSLNAAVEAARAGEHGKGFAVVADAVRNLAQRSAEAAKDIDSLVKETRRKTEQGSELASSGEVVLKEIVKGSSDLAVLIKEISAESQNQSSRIKSVSETTTQLDEVTQANAIASEETALASEKLLEQSDSLKKVVSNLAAITGLET